MVIASRAWEQLRPWPVYVMAAALPVSLAVTNLAKALVLLVALAILAQSSIRQDWPQWPRRLGTPLLVALLLGAAALSMVYTSAAPQESWRALAKHAKLLLIPVALLLLRSREEARRALFVFIAVQGFVVLSSWLLSFGLPLPWAREDRNSPGTVFTSYLDQSMLTALFAVLCWHLRSEFPGRWGAHWAALLTVVAVVNLFVVIPGRSGQFALLPVIALSMWWILPRRARWAALLVPLAIASAAYASSPQFKQRADAVIQETRDFADGKRDLSSSGLRLRYWSSSLHAMQERPFTGYGVGSWNREFRRIQGPGLDPSQHALRNPHQEYLLWGVELGLTGAALVVVLFATAAWDARHFPEQMRKATRAVVLLVATMALTNSVLFDAVTGETLALVLGALLAMGITSREAVNHSPATQRVA